MEKRMAKHLFLLRQFCKTTVLFVLMTLKMPLTKSNKIRNARLLVLNDTVETDSRVDDVEVFNRWSSLTVFAQTVLRTRTTDRNQVLLVQKKPEQFRISKNTSKK